MEKTLDMETKSRSSGYIKHGVYRWQGRAVTVLEPIGGEGVHAGKLSFMVLDPA